MLPINGQAGFSGAGSNATRRRALWQAAPHRDKRRGLRLWWIGPWYGLRQKAHDLLVRKKNLRLGSIRELKRAQQQTCSCQRRSHA